MQSQQTPTKLPRRLSLFGSANGIGSNGSKIGRSAKVSGGDDLPSVPSEKENFKELLPLEDFPSTSNSGAPTSRRTSSIFSSSHQSSALSSSSSGRKRKMSFIGSSSSLLNFVNGEKCEDKEGGTESSALLSPTQQDRRTSFTSSTPGRMQPPTTPTSANRRQSFRKVITRTFSWAHHPTAGINIEKISEHAANTVVDSSSCSLAQLLLYGYEAVERMAPQLLGEGRERSTSDPLPASPLRSASTSNTTSSSSSSSSSFSELWLVEKAWKSLEEPEARFGLGMALLHIFDANGRVFALLRHILQEELQAISSSSVLFRESTAGIKVLTAWLGGISLKFISSLLGSQISTLLESSQSIEVDPTRLAPGESLEINQNTLITVSSQLFESIFNSISDAPPELRRFFGLVVEETEARFPGMGNRGIASFFFLRLLCAAIVNPAQRDLNSNSGDSGKRRLVLCCKTVQALANEVPFGEKEQYLQFLNPLLSRSLPKLHSFYQGLSTSPSSITCAPSPFSCTSSGVDDAGFILPARVELSALQTVHSVLTNALESISTLMMNNGLRSGRALNVLNKSLEHFASEVSMLTSSTSITSTPALPISSGTGASEKNPSTPGHETHHTKKRRPSFIGSLPLDR